MPKRSSTQVHALWFAVLGLGAALATCCQVRAQALSGELLSLNEEEETIATLLADGDYGAAIQQAQPVLANMLDDISSAWVTQERRDPAELVSLRFRLWLGALRGNDAVPPLKPGGQPSPAHFAYTELVVTLAAQANLLGAEGALPPDVLQDLASEAEAAAWTYMSASETHLAENALAHARALLDQVPTDEDDELAQTERFQLEQVDAALLLQTVGVEAFLHRTAEIVRPYKDTGWIVERAAGAMSNIGTVAPDDDEVEYAYLMVLENELRDNQADPALPSLYSRLGNMALSLHRPEEARRWYETFPELAPQDNRASIVRQLLSLDANESTTAPEQSGGASEPEPRPLSAPEARSEAAQPPQTPESTTDTDAGAAGNDKPPPVVKRPASSPSQPPMSAATASERPAAALRKPPNEPLRRGPATTMDNPIAHASSRCALSWLLAGVLSAGVVVAVIAAAVWIRSHAA